MKGHLIRIDAQDAAGSPVVLRLASIDHPALCHLAGATWWPGIARLPALRYDFFGGDFRGAITAPQAAFAAAIEGWPGFAGARFAGARVRLWSGELGAAFAGYTLLFDGMIAREPQVERGIAAFDAGPDDAWLDKPLLALFAGTGGIEGPDALEGQAKPLALGTLRFAGATQIDAVDNVWCLSGYGAVQAVTAAYDRVASLGAPGGDHASLAALIAATIPNGGWATCKAQGLVRFGAPPDGKVSFDLQGDAAAAGGFAELPGEVIGRIAEIAGGTVDAANLAALDAARPWPLAMDISSQTTARQAIQEIADSIGAVAGISWTGTLFVQPLGFGTPTLTLAVNGSTMPQVAEVTALPVAAPFWRLATRAEPTWVVHDPGEVASGYNYRGEWSATRVYRLDDWVSMPDGTGNWLYIGASPSSGNVPEAGSAFWTYFDGSQGISTTRWPALPPDDPVIGSLYFDATNQPFRFEGNVWLFEGEPVTFEGDPVTMPGWVSVRDKSLTEVVLALQTVDDDGVLTIDEKIRIVIPESSRLEAIYQGIAAQAAALGLSANAAIVAAGTARTAWLALRDGLTPAWNDTSAPSPIVRADWDDVLDTYRTALETAKAALSTSTSVTVVPPEAQTVLVDGSGAPASGEYPRDLNATVKRGAVAIDLDDDVSYAIALTGDLAATVENTDGDPDKGTITVTAGTEGTIALTVTVGDVAFGPYPIAFTASAGTTSVIGANGYRVYPDGYIEQWVTMTAASGESTATFDWPIPFPTACVWASAGTKIAAANTDADGWIQLIDWDTDGGTIQRQYSDAGTGDTLTAMILGKGH